MALLLNSPDILKTVVSAYFCEIGGQTLTVIPETERCIVANIVTY